MHNIDENTPSTIVFLGTEDRLIPATAAQKYKKLMNDRGRRCDLHLYKGQGHGFFNFRNEEYFTKTVVEADRFLASLGYLQGKPTLQNRPDAGDGQ